MNVAVCRLLFVGFVLVVRVAADLVTHGPWSGGVTDTAAVVVAKLAEPTPDARLEVSEDEDFGDSQFVGRDTPPAGGLEEIVRFQVSGLKPSTRYHYRIRGAGPADGSGRGTLVTFPAAGTPTSFRFTVSSCARTGSTHQVFNRIAAQNPLFHLTTGDLHYENIDRNSRGAFRDAYESVMISPSQAALYRRVPFIYTWDDHDFGPNGSDRHSPSREASLLTYREYVPHYPLAWDEERRLALIAPGQPPPAALGPITQAFTVGRARFLVLDARSERDDAAKTDTAGKTMLGSWQKAWLKRELLASKGRDPLVFIVSSVSWVSNETTTRDNWGRYATERAELSDWMVENGVTGVCFLSGDAHMLAADDGRNNRYGRHQGPGFPALQAAPLDRSGSVKGGPWSVEPVLPAEGEGQFGLVQVEDRGDRIDVLFLGLNHDAREKLRLAFSVPAGR